ncbi:MAG: PIN domain-containing protein [Gemmatimonadota bacterium]
MGVLIDATVLIDFERAGRSASPWIESHREEAVFLSVITASELLHGVHRTRRSAMQSRRAAFVEASIGSLPLLPVDLPIARVHARLWADLSAQGSFIGPHDTWLAATCLAHDLTMLTANAREFNRVKGLEVEIWSMD